MKFHGYFVVITVICYINICYADCQEYVLFLKTKKCGKYTSIKPIGIKETTCSPLQTYNEISRCKRSVLELHCLGIQTSCEYHYNVTNNSSHTYTPDVDKKPTVYTILPTDVIPTTPSVVDNKSLIEKDLNIDRKTYNVEIIYVNEEVIDNTKDKSLSKLECQHAEFVCNDKISGKNCDLKKYKITDPGKTKRTLTITLKRNDTTEVQPIFTGYTNNSIPTIAPFEYFKTVSLTCGFANDYDCQEENVAEFNLNIIVKANYIQNNTRSIYTNCVKAMKTENINTLELECEGFENQYILSVPQKDKKAELNLNNQSNPEILMWRCQKLDSSGSKTVGSLTNYKLIYLQNCSNVPNTFNLKETDDKTMFITLQNKPEIDNDTTTKSPAGSAHPESASEKGNTTLNKPNCNSYPLLNITKGKIINLDVGTRKETLLTSNVMKINMLNCFENTISRNNGTLTHKENYTDTVSLSKPAATPQKEHEIVIVLKNGSLNNMDLTTINRTAVEALGKNRYYLQCNDLEDNIAERNKTNVNELKCKWIKLDDLITDKLKTIDNATHKYTAKDLLNKISKNYTKIEKHNNTKPKETESNIVETKGNIIENKNNVRINKDDVVDKRENVLINKESAIDKKSNVTINKKDIKGTKNNITEAQNINVTTENIIDKTTDDVFDVIVSTVSPKSLGEAKLNKIQARINKARSAVAAGQNGPAEEEGIEKILFIVIASVAGTALILVIALRKFFRTEEEEPTPTARAPNQEETSF